MWIKFKTNLNKIEIKNCKKKITQNHKRICLFQKTKDLRNELEFCKHHMNEVGCSIVKQLKKKPSNLKTKQ